MIFFHCWCSQPLTCRFIFYQNKLNVLQLNIVKAVVHLNNSHRSRITLRDKSELNLNKQRLNMKSDFYFTASSLTICKLNDPKRDECIRESIETFIPTLRRNQKNAKILILDPFTYDSITLNYKNTNSIVGTFTVRDVRTYGFSRNAKMRKVKTEFTDDTMVIQGELSVPKIFSTGNYTSNMNFNSFKIASQGQYNVTMKDIVSKLSIKGKLETIDGEDYMKVYKFDFVPTIENMKMSLSGLFPDPTLSKNRKYLMMENILNMFQFQTASPTNFSTKTGNLSQRKCYPRHESNGNLFLRISATNSLRNILSADF